MSEINRIYTLAHRKLLVLNKNTNFECFLPITSYDSVHKINHFNQMLTTLHTLCSEQMGQKENIVSKTITYEYSEYVKDRPLSLNSTNLSNDFLGLVNGAIYYNLVTTVLPTQRSSVPEIVFELSKQFEVLSHFPINDYASGAINVISKSQIEMMKILYRLFSNDPVNSFKFEKLAPRTGAGEDQLLRMEKSSERVLLIYPNAQVEYRKAADMIIKIASAPNDEIGLICLNASEKYETKEFIGSMFAQFELPFNLDLIYTCKQVQHKHN